MQTDVSMADTPAPTPAPILRPGLAEWLWKRGLNLRQGAAPLKISHEWLRRLCLPFGDPSRVEPDEDLLRLIADYTGGEIGPADFQPPTEVLEREQAP